MNYIALTLYKNILNEIPLFRLLYIHYEFGVNGTYVHSMTQKLRVERLSPCMEWCYESERIHLLLYLHVTLKFRLYILENL